MVTIDDVRAVVDGFPRSYEVLVRDRVKFRVGSIVYVAFSHDETLMGFAFPKEERDALDRVRARQVPDAEGLGSTLQLGRRPPRRDRRSRAP